MGDSRGGRAATSGRPLINAAAGPWRPWAAQAGAGPGPGGLRGDADFHPREDGLAGLVFGAELGLGFLEGADFGTDEVGVFITDAVGVPVVLVSGAGGVRLVRVG